MILMLSVSTLKDPISVTVNQATREIATHIEVCCQLPSNCDPNTVCINTQGSYKCDCKPGYQGDSYTYRGMLSVTF